MVSFVCLSQFEHVDKRSKGSVAKRRFVTKRNIIWKLRQFIQRKKEETVWCEILKIMMANGLGGDMEYHCLCDTE